MKYADREPPPVTATSSKIVRTSLYACGSTYHVIEAPGTLLGSHELVINKSLKLLDALVEHLLNDLSARKSASTTLKFAQDTQPGNNKQLCCTWIVGI